MIGINNIAGFGINNDLDRCIVFKEFSEPLLTFIQCPFSLLSFGNIQTHADKKRYAIKYYSSDSDQSPADFWSPVNKYSNFNNLRRSGEEYILYCSMYKRTIIRMKKLSDISTGHFTFSSACYFITKKCVPPYKSPVSIQHIKSIVDPDF